MNRLIMGCLRIKLIIIGIALGWCIRSYVQMHNYNEMDLGLTVFEQHHATFADACFVGLH